MSLSTKEVSNDLHEINWTKNSCNLETLPKPRSTKRQQQQQQQPEHLKCPRCESTNTKFCYYNNYNKTQPRHFCKACKRHWTKGGTLRNVPEGGGRKNKRLKRPNATTNANANITPMSQKILPLGVRIQKGPSNIKTTVTKPTGNEWSSTSPQTFSIDMQVGSNDPTWDFNGCFMNSTFQAPQNPSLGFGSSSLSLFDAIPTSVPSSLSSLNGLEVGEKVDMLETHEDSTITSIFPRCASSTIGSQPWQGTSSTNSFIDLPSYWNWNMDVDTMVLADLNIPWDDSEFYNP